jgi:hypothetical protein
VTKKKSPFIFKNAGTEPPGFLDGAGRGGGCSAWIWRGLAMLRFQRENPILLFEFPQAGNGSIRPASL